MRRELSASTMHNIAILGKQLRSSEPPPSTYRKYQQQPDGTIIFIGEFATPEVIFKFNNAK